MIYILSYDIFLESRLDYCRFRCTSRLSHLAPHCATFRAGGYTYCKPESTGTRSVHARAKEGKILTMTPTRRSIKRVADAPPAAHTEARRPRVEEKGSDVFVDGGCQSSIPRVHAALSPAGAPVDPTHAQLSMNYPHDCAHHKHSIHVSHALLTDVPPEPTRREWEQKAHLEATELVQLETVLVGAKHDNQSHVTNTIESSAHNASGNNAIVETSAAPGAGGGTAMIRGLPKRWSERDFSKWLDLLVISRTRCKKKKSWSYGFITFSNLNDRLTFLNAMEGCKIEGRLVSAHDAMNRKVGDHPGAGVDAFGPSAVATGRTRDDLLVAAADRGARRDVRDAVCPMWNVPYACQLLRKREKVGEALRQLTRTVVRRCKRMKKSHNCGDWRWPSWIAQANSRGEMAAYLEGIVRSPVLDGYRNKSEFTIGPDADGRPTVGFNVGLFKEGVTAIASPEKCRHISSVAKMLAAGLQSYLRAQANSCDPLALPVWDKRRGTGFWRLLTVREGGFASDTGEWSKWKRDFPTANTLEETDVDFISDTNKDAVLAYPTVGARAETMVVVQVSPEGFDKTREALSSLAGVLRDLAASSATPFTLTHALAQIHQGVSNAAATDAPLLDLATYAAVDPSKRVIHERLCGLRFSLSATAFFQVNTCAAEVLYRLAGEWANPTGKSLLLDVCCGTGTIGLILSSQAKKVIGVDVVAAAVKDAKANAQLNGVENCEWIEGKAEEVIPEILSQCAPFIAPAVPDVTLECPYATYDDGEESGEEPDDAEFYDAALVSANQKSMVDTKPMKYEYDDVVAVVDPPRAGLHKNVLWALRKETRLRRLVYVSCNPGTMAADCAVLCTPQGLDGNGAGTPFRPMRAMAVDLFPHTAHCEAVLLLER